jgi:hypothetical protein
MEMPAGVLAGLCPACLLKQGVAGDTGLMAKFTPPSLDELAPLLPQLEILNLIGSGGMGRVFDTDKGLPRACQRCEGRGLIRD